MNGPRIENIPKITTRIDIQNIIFDYCEACLDTKENMSIPQGAFAAKKIRKNLEKREHEYRLEEKQEARYNSKYMNSIWGMYNRFSVHNLKKIMDLNQVQRNAAGQGFGGLQATSQFSISVERLSYLPL